MAEFSSRRPRETVRLLPVNRTTAAPQYSSTSVICIEQRQDRYLRSPRLVSHADGTAALYVIAWERAGERVLVYPIGADGQLGEPCAGSVRSAIVALTRGDTICESPDANAELVEVRAGQRVWVEHDAGVASVKLQRPGRPCVLVFRGRGCACAPTLAVAADGGSWVGFHTDVREDTGRVDIAKWIALRFVDAAGEVWQPAAAMTDRDRDRVGVEQSFEFPAVVLGCDGALALFGRGSHNFFRQDFSRSGASARVATGDGEWGSRGRQLAAGRVAAGVVTARREREGICVELGPLPQGGVPQLERARVDWASEELAQPEPRTTRSAAFSSRPLRPLFGDLQQHSAHSDGLGTADEVYLRARYRYGDDFVALTDHESFLGKRIGPGEWEYLQQVADRYADEGKFATLLAYEWTGQRHPGPGHKCVYLPRPGLPIVSRDDVPTGGELVQRVKALGGFASPHHIGWTGADAADHDAAGQPLWEICSCHGCYEYAGHPLGQRGELGDQMIDQMLARGLRFGFTAASDSHGLLFHHGQARKRDPYRTGLTAVQADNLSRGAIMDALRARRCYATSGTKILLDVRADGAPMGSELLDRDGAVFEVWAAGTAQIHALEVVGATGVVACVRPDAYEATLRVQVRSPYAYARVIQVDGEMAWSSPVFFGPRPAVTGSDANASSAQA